jgi:hypothetical protein
VGAVLSFPMTYGRMRNDEPIKVWDRAYRLRYNLSQHRVDRFTAAGAGAHTIYTRAVACARAWAHAGAP